MDAVASLQAARPERAHLRVGTKASEESHSRLSAGPMPGQIVTIAEGPSPWQRQGDRLPFKLLVTFSRVEASILINGEQVIDHDGWLVYTVTCC